MFAKSFLSVAALAAVTGLAVSTASASITIPTVPIGNPGNAPDPTTGLGSVAYTYNIGATEVTNAQYAAFLNAKAKSDPFELYHVVMGNSAVNNSSITRSGSDGSYTYSVASGRENYPAAYTTFWNQARFVNWLHNGQGNGDTETGAYTLGGVASPVNASVNRNPGWTWALPSANEWHKAAFHQPASVGGDVDDYWLYTTSSNTAPTIAEANILRGISPYVGNGSTPVGSYAPNYYGTFDMGGNVMEYTEEFAYYNEARQLRGGSYVGLYGLAAGQGGLWSLTQRENTIGFRVVQIFTPGAVALLGFGGLFVVCCRRR